MVTTRSQSCSSYLGEIRDFFKVYLPQFSSQTMILPPALTKYMNPVDFSLTTTIRNVGNNKVWRVEIRKSGEYMAFEQDWPVFVRDNSLKEGSFLIFAYHRISSEFRVKLFGVYGENQWNIKYPPIATRKEAVEVIMSEDREDHNLVPEKPFFVVDLKATHTRYGPVNIPKRFAGRYMRNIETNDCLLKCADKSWSVKLLNRNGKLLLNDRWNLFARDNSLALGQICKFELICARGGYTFDVSVSAADSTPSFLVNVGQTHLKYSVMYIPKKFVKRHMNDLIKTAVLKYKRKEWAVNLTGDMQRYFGEGLHDFLMNNNLKEGITCVFKLIKKVDEYVFNVSICT